MIYCVEDERNIRELLVYTLGTTGFEAKGFGDGKEFKKALKEELPELILLDIMLPGEDGYTLLEELKNELLFSNLNVSQLADEFHFSDPSHLMRFFKKETGKTFTQYLMNYKRGIYE